MANSWNGPQLGSPIRTDVPELQKKFIALLKGDPTSVADIPSGAKRLVNTSGTQWQVQQYNGSSWAAIGKLMHDVDKLDGYHAAITPAANTVAVRNADKKLEGDITGNAATASSAATLSETLPVNKGGTEATTSAQARVNLGVPPTSHASTATTYGVANASQYGHVKLSDAVDSASGATGGTAATPAAVKAAVTQANSALEAFAEGQAQKDAGQDAKIAEAQSSADAKLPLAGGTMTGSIVFPSGKIFSAVNEEFAGLWISGSTEWGLGALLTLFDVSKGGGWIITTRNGDGSQPGILNAVGDSLTWNSRPILTSVGGNVDALTVAGQTVVRSVNGVAANAAGDVSDIAAKGSNFIRFTNGLQICYSPVELKQYVTDTKVTFGAAFNMYPTVTITDSNGNNWRAVTWVTVSSFNYVTGGQLGQGYGYYIAIGTWK